MTRVGTTARPIGSDALFATERDVLDLWEGGLSTQQIVDQGVYSRRFVTNTIGMFGTTSDGGWSRMVRQGSAQLLAALRRHHPERCA